MVLVRAKTLLLVIATIALAWLYFHPAWLVHTIHLTRSDSYYSYVVLFYRYLPVLVFMPIVGAALSLFLAWSWWSLSYFELDDNYITYAVRPIMSNSIPIRAIQDIRVQKSWMGIIFGYGTLIVDAGRQEESLTYVPQVDRFLGLLYSR